jgi:integrase
MSRQKIPSLRHHKPSGRAVVTLNGKDIYLGPWDSGEAQEAYDRKVQEWLTRNRRPEVTEEEKPLLSVSQVLVRFLDHAESYYVRDGKPTSELGNLKRVIRTVRELYGRTPAPEFGPKALKACRNVFVEQGLVRNGVNANVQRIKRMFRWAVEEELVPGGVIHGLDAVRGLRRGRTEAKEGKKVLPVQEDHVDAILPHVSGAVCAMVRLQLATGMRPGEVVLMRRCDIDQSEETWTYRPAQHKTEHHGHDRVVYLGPKAREILAPFLEREETANLFSPREAEEARNAKRKVARVTPMTPSHRARTRREGRARAWRERYDVNTYRRAIQRGCEKAGIATWHPHQLRHNFATRLRRDHDAEVVRVLLGHRSVEVTAIYTQIEERRASDVIGRVG